MTAQPLIQEASRLFSLPDVAIRLNQLLATEDTSTRQIVELVELDPGLAASVLKLANSAYYGLSKRVDTIARALAVIGQRELQAMALATSVVKTFKGLPADLVDMASFWDNSVTCGVIARLLARRCRNRYSDQLFLAGLLHAVGRLVFYARFADEYRVLLTTVDGADAHSLAAAEWRVFGCDYATLGGELLEAWKLPPLLQTLVGGQLSPTEPGDFAGERALLHVAIVLAASVSPVRKDTPPREASIADFDPTAWALLGLDESVIDEVVLDTRTQTMEILAIINPEAAVIY